jgi:hypothetical protein
VRLDFVHVVIELVDLDSLLHDRFLHEEGWPDWGILSLSQELDSIVNQGKIEESSVALQEISSVA